MSHLVSHLLYILERYFLLSNPVSHPIRWLMSHLVSHLFSMLRMHDLYMASDVVAALVLVLFTVGAINLLVTIRHFKNLYN